MVVGCNVNFLAYRYKTEGEDDDHQFVFLMVIMINEDIDERNYHRPRMPCERHKPEAEPAHVYQLLCPICKVIIMMMIMIMIMMMSNMVLCMPMLMYISYVVLFARLLR